ncbi:MAG: glutathione transport system substrate-binding protein [Actinomycetota bacterium]|jgi:peptide/nickel transport system substrate-binding protein
MRLKYSAGLIGGVLAIALIAGACGSDSKNNKTTAGSGSSAPTAGAVDINATPRAQVKDGGTFRYPLTAFPANFNPNELDGGDTDVAAVTGGLLPAPFKFNGKAEPVLDKDYVTSAELTSKDPQVVTYQLNPKAVWDDGTKVSEADYEALWNAMKTSEGTAYQIVASNGYDQIASVKAGKDDHEVIVTFAHPFADWQSLFGGLVPASTSKDPKVFNEGWVNKPLTTAGPFKVDTVDPTAKTITVARNEKWWGDKAKLDKIVFIAIDIDSQVDSLANGEIDYVDIGPSVDTYQRAKGISGVTIHRAGGPNFRHITINGTGPILSDVKVRHALALAIDRKTIARALIGPLGGTPDELNNHIFMSNQKGYKNNAGDLATADPTKAAAELDAAGWKLNGTDKIRTKDGKQLVIRMVIPSQVSTSEQESNLIAGMFDKVGAKLQIDTVPSDDFFEKYVTPGDFDMTVFSWIGTPFPISSSKSIYANPTKGADGLDIQQNYARVGSAEIDNLFNEATAELDPAKAIDIANHIDKLIWDEVHSLADYQRPDLVATKSNVANFGALGFSSVVWQDIGFTK